MSVPNSRRPVVSQHHRKCARLIVCDGLSVSEALLQAGYSPKQAKKSLNTVRRTVGLRFALRHEFEKHEIPPPPNVAAVIYGSVNG